MSACAVSHPTVAKAAHRGLTSDWQNRAMLQTKTTSDCARDMMLYERQKVPRQALPIPSKCAPNQNQECRCSESLKPHRIMPASHALLKNGCNGQKKLETRTGLVRNKTYSNKNNQPRRSSVRRGFSSGVGGR